ncbi:hypothetical protein L484_011427 [Morus notabilis]|uniref:Uncharacterized protein n=1 Tax=Morus notabilis TaxID=981085 RepID=W9QTA4_9ROSA|nr:hypothetical protein L484_011427 [Morus notabilis]
MKSILKHNTLLVNKRYLASFGQWSVQAHWESIEIEARNSLIGIQGLPLNMWNIHSLKIIRDACGGLSEVAEETLNQSFLLYAKIKVRGPTVGLMNPILEFPCQGEKVSVGLFSIKMKDEVISNYRTSGIIRRSSLDFAREDVEVADRCVNILAMRMVHHGKNVGGQKVDLKCKKMWRIKNQSGREIEEFLEKRSQVDEAVLRVSRVPTFNKGVGPTSSIIKDNLILEGSIQTTNSIIFFGKPRFLLKFRWGILYVQGTDLSNDSDQIGTLVFEEFSMIGRASGEPMDHLLLHCLVASFVWQKLISEAGFSWVLPAHCSLVLTESLVGLNLNSISKVISKDGVGQVDLLILDTLYKTGSHNVHLCLPQTLEALKRIRPKQALLIGMTHQFDHHKDNEFLAEWSKREGIQVQLAHDGLRVPIDL